jgi:hypothetical protein
VVTGAGIAQDFAEAGAHVAEKGGMTLQNAMALTAGQVTVDIIALRRQELTTNDVTEVLSFAANRYGICLHPASRSERSYH